ncbi:hypothetical protein BY458DRAFT_489724 [Sporodiniella umbellata]|nr:hypothetical protein BY458DRAFT_489724 [Sporodiniella umbellata]
MSISTKRSFNYKYSDIPSINHPSVDKDLNDSFSYESGNPIRLPSSESSIKLSTRFEPILRETILTEQELARHNSMYTHISDSKEQDEEEDEEKRLLSRVDERCKSLKKEFEKRMKQLEDQLLKTEQGFSQSRSDIEELQSLEKEYINQGIQTDIRYEDMEKIQKVADVVDSASLSDIKEWKNNYGHLQNFVEQTKKLIWETPFIPIQSICRQIPTPFVEEDVCEYHRQRINAIQLRSEKTKTLYRSDNQSTLDKINHWANAIKQNSFFNH